MVLDAVTVLPRRNVCIQNALIYDDRWVYRFSVHMRTQQVQPEYAPTAATRNIINWMVVVYCYGQRLAKNWISIEWKIAIISNNMCWV